MDPDITDAVRARAAALVAELDGKPLRQWFDIIVRALASPTEGVEPVALWRMSDWDGWHYAVPPCAVSDEEMRRIGWEPLFAAPPPPVAEAGDAGGEAVAIKPLEWEPVLNKDGEHEGDKASTGVGDYTVVVDPFSYSPTTAYYVEGPNGFRAQCGLPDAAKAAAQSDHEACIRSCLATPSPRPEAETASGVDGETVNEKMREALRDAARQENSMARRMRAAIVEARKRLAKGRALWNGPCHECDAVLAEALTAACPVRPEAETASGVDGVVETVESLIKSLNEEADLWERDLQPNAAKNARTLVRGVQKALDAIRALHQTGEKGR